MTYASVPADSCDGSGVSASQVADLVRKWVHDAASRPAPSQARMLADLLADPKGLDFTVGFVDRVVRTEDPAAAAEALRKLAM